MFSASLSLQHLLHIFVLPIYPCECSKFRGFDTAPWVTPDDNDAVNPILTDGGFWFILCENFVSPFFTVQRVRRTIILLKRKCGFFKCFLLVTFILVERNATTNKCGTQKNGISWPKRNFAPTCGQHFIQLMYGFILCEFYPLSGECVERIAL